MTRVRWYQYQFGDAVIGCDVALPELTTARPGAEPLIVVRRARPGGAKPRRWDQKWTSAGNVWGRMARVGDRYWLAFARGGDFLVDAQAQTVRYAPSRSKPARWRHLLIAQVLPRCLAHAGQLVLHGGAIDIGGHGVAVVGASGTGKSSLAAALARAGHTVVADDCVVVRDAGGAEICGTYRGIRLWPDSARAVLGERDSDDDDDKQLFASQPLGLNPSGRVPLRAILFLSERHRARVPVLETLTSRETVLELLRHSFQLDGSDNVSAARHFGTLTRMAQSTRAFRLRYPRSYARLSGVCRTIEAAVRGAPASA